MHLQMSNLLRQAIMHVALKWYLQFRALEHHRPLKSRPHPCLLQSCLQEADFLRSCTAWIHTKLLNVFMIPAGEPLELKLPYHS